MNDLFNALLSLLERTATLIANFLVIQKDCSEVAFWEEDGVLLYFIAVDKPDVVLLVLLLGFHLPPQFHEHDGVEECQILFILAAQAQLHALGHYFIHDAVRWCE